MKTDGFEFSEVERVSGLTPEEFQTRYAARVTPVILTDFAKDWSATEKWTPDYFKSKYGENKVKVFSGDFGKPGDTYMSRADIMEFGEYLDEILGYIMSHDGVWQTTADEIAEFYIANYYDQAVAHAQNLGR